MKNDIAQKQLSNYLGIEEELHETEKGSSEHNCFGKLGRTQNQYTVTYKSEARLYSPQCFMKAKQTQSGLYQNISRKLHCDLSRQLN